MLLAFVTVIVTTTRKASAAAGTNKQINFQGKVTNPDGTNVADGNYTFVFSIYTAASGGSPVWTDTETLAVNDGIFQYNLGSDTVNAPLPGSVDFNSDNIYLGMTFNNDPDGEMVPRIRFTSAAYAFNADKIDGLEGSQLVQLSPSLQQTGNINVSGSGTFGNGLTASAGGLSVTGNSTFVGDGVFTGTLSVDADGSSTSSPRTISWTNLSSGEAARFQFADANTAIQQSFNGRMTMYAYYGIEIRGSRQTTAPSFASGVSSDASLTVYTPAGSRRGLIIQGSSSQSADLMQAINSSAQTIFAIRSNGNIALGSPGNVTGAVIFNNSSNSNAVTLNSAVTSGSYALTLPTSAPSTDQCFKSDSSTASQLVFGDCGVTTVGTFSGSSIANGASISGNTITFGAADETNPGMVSTGAQTFGGAKTFSAQTTVSANSTATADIVGGLTVSIAANPGSSSSANYAGILASSTSNSGNVTSFSVLTSVLGQSTYSGSGTLGYLTALNGGILNTSTGTVTNGFGIFIDAAINSGGGTITNNYGLFVESQNAGTNNYGIYIEDANTYALFVDAGYSRFDGLVRIGSGGTNDAAQGDGELYVQNDLEVDGEYIGVTISGLGLSDCDNATTSKLLYDSATKVFSCGTDQTGGGTGVTIGTINGTTKSANGVVISGSTVYMQTADAAYPGLVSTGAQTMAGDKTFNGNVVIGATSGVNDANDVANAPLEVQGSMIRLGDYTSSATFTNGLGIKFADAGTSHGSLRYMSGDELFQFCDSSGSSTTLACDGTAAMTVDVDNNFVGIGTDTPDSALHVESGGYHFRFTGASAGLQSLTGGSSAWANFGTADSSDIMGFYNSSNISVGAITALGNFNFAGNGTVSGGSMTLGSTSQAGTLVLSDGSSNTIGLTVTGVSSSYTLTLPSGAPSTGQCLKSGSSTATTLEWGGCGGAGTGTVAIELAPEYAGAVLEPDGTNNTGLMNSGFCSGGGRKSINTSVCGTNDEHSYYEWTTNSGTNDYDIYVRYKMPSDFASFVSDTTVSMSGWRTDATTNSVELALFQANNTQCGSTTNVATGTAAWSTVSLSGSETSCSISAGDVVIFRVRLTATASDFVRAGEITFSYNKL